MGLRFTVSNKLTERAFYLGKRVEKQSNRKLCVISQSCAAF